MQHVRNRGRWPLALALAVVLSAAGRAAPPGVEALQQAEKLYRAGDLLEAEPLYQAAARGGRGEQRRQAYDRLLTLYARLGRPDRAVRTALEYQPWLERQGDRARLQRLGLELGHDYLALGHYVEAEKAIQEALGDRRAAALPRMQQLNAWADLARVAEHRRDRPLAAERWATVERLARAALDEPRLRADKDLCVHLLADAYGGLGRPAEAAAALRPLLERYAEAHDTPGQREVLRRRAALLGAAGDHAAAEADLRRALALPVAADEGPLTRADQLAELAGALARRGRRDAAAAARKQAAEAYRAVLEGARADRPRSAQAAEAFWKLERLYEAGRLYRQALSLTEEQAAYWTSETPVRPRLRAEQGSLQVLFSAYDQARRPLADAVADLERQDPPDLHQLPRALIALALAELYAGRPARAEELGQKCLALHKRYELPEGTVLAEAHNALGTAAALGGDYALAVKRYREGAALCEKLGDVAAPQHSYLLLNLAVLHKSQGEPAEALQACLKALALYRRFAAADALGFACFDAALAGLYAADGRYAEADARAGAVLRLCGRYEITAGPLVVAARHCQALRRLSERDAAAAEKLWRDVLAGQEKERDRLLLPRTLNYLGLAAELQGRPRDAEALYRRAADLQAANPRALPATHFISLWRLAEVAGAAGRRDEALRLLGQAVDVAEAARLRLYGDAKQRTAFFAQFVMAFERLVDWNVEAGRPEEACRAAARGRSRALLDQMQLAGVDPRQALKGAAGEQLKREEEGRRRRLAAVQARAQLIPVGDAAGPRARAVLAELEKAQGEYEDTWRRILNDSPLYRGLGAEKGADTLAGLRQRVLRKDNLLLWYWVGRERSYLFLVGESSRPVEVFPLSVPPAAARALARARPRGGVKPAEDTRGFAVRPAPATDSAAAPGEGPLDESRARGLVDLYLAYLLPPATDTKRGLRVQARAGAPPVPLTEAEAVAAALLPPAARARVKELAPEYLLVVPDGPLHKLPLEALVLREGPPTRYVLDELPPLVYAPSAAVLAALPALPGRQSPPAGPPTLLTVGDVAYREAKGAAPATFVPGMQALGGALARLPKSGEESRRVARLFDPSRVTPLEKEAATEKAVTAAAPGKRYLHLAAHGFVDERYGNLFGALALAPPPPGRVPPGDDDGFLELHEIYQLPLKGCELAVLSACETNVGPQRPLEAGVTLAGGFLAAGARRVVASHWSVDDNSTAELVGTFFEEVKKAQSGGRVSFARALQKARQQVRSRPEWSAPFYWAPFVLVGPGD